MGGYVLELSSEESVSFEFGREDWELEDSEPFEELKEEVIWLQAVTIVKNANTDKADRQIFLIFRIKTPSFAKLRI